MKDGTAVKHSLCHEAVGVFDPTAHAEVDLRDFVIVCQQARTVGGSLGEDVSVGVKRGDGRGDAAGKASSRTLCAAASSIPARMARRLFSTQPSLAKG